ncbi:MAG: Ig-like domain-containing protein, partial [Candidatus Moraniibacteriota bacterium]
FASAELGATYNYSIDDTDVGTAAVTGTGTISTATDQITGINVAGLTDGTLTLTVYLTDPAGNQGANTTDTVVKDTTAPAIMDNYASDGTWVNTDQTVTLAPTGADTVKYCTGASCDPAGGTTLTDPWSLLYNSNQNTIVRYQAYDNAGNQSAVGEYNVKVDKNVPTSSNITIIADETTSQTFDILWTATDTTGTPESGVQGVILYYSVDGGSNWTAYNGGHIYTASPISFVAPQTGTFNFYARAVDNAGNEMAAPTDASYIQDTIVAQPTTVYVCPSGNCGHASGWDDYSTIQSGIDAVKADGTVNVGDGTYDLVSRIEIDKAVSVIGNTTTPSNVVVNAPTAGGTQHGQNSVFMILSNDVTVRGFKIQGALRTGVAQNAGIYVDDPRLVSNPGLSNITISDNELTNNGWGIFVHNIKDSIISSNRIHGSIKTGDAGNEYDAGSGIVVFGRAEDTNHTHNLTIDNNQVFSNETDGIRIDVSSTVGAVLWTNDLAITISDNVIYNNGRAIGGVDKYIGIKSSGYSMGVTVTGNEIYGQTMNVAQSADNQSSGIWLAASKGWGISDNDIHNNLNGIFLAYSTAEVGSGSHIITGNDIYDNVRGISIDDGAEAVANNNEIYSNDSTDFSGIGFTPADVYNRGGIMFDATKNWWDSVDDVAIAAKINGSVDYLPFCLTDACTTFGTGISPTVVLSSATPNPTNGLIAVTATFNENVTEFIAGDVSVTNGVVGNFAGSDAIYTFDVNPTDGASVAVTINVVAGVAQDAATNTNEVSNTLSYTSDTVDPTVTIDAPAVINNANKAAYTVTGTCSENTRTVSVNIGGVVSTPVCTGLAWTTTSDVSGVADNAALAITANHSDAAGNNATQSSTSVVKDTVAPIISRSIIKSTLGSIGGYIKAGDTYYTYAQVDDATSGIGAVIADLSNVTATESAEAMVTAGGPWTIDSISYNYRSAQYTSSALAEGTPVFTVDATDSAANGSTQFGGSVLVDNSASNNPSVSVYDSSLKGTTFTTDTWHDQDTPYAEWIAPTDNPVANSGIAGYFICVDTAGTCDPSTAGTYQTGLNFTFPVLTNGQTYYLRMEVKDNAGNITSIAGNSFVYKYDNENPVATGASVTDDGAWTNSTNTLHADWSGFTDNISVTAYDYSIGTSAGDTSVKGWTNTTSTNFTDATLSLVSGTNYFVNVRAKDQAGNVSAVVSSDGIRSDLVAPTATLATSPASDDEAFTVSWSGTTDALSGPNGHYKIRYKDQAGGVWTDWLADTTLTSDTFESGDVAGGFVSGHTYYFEALGQDVAGNWEVAAGGLGEAETVYDITAPNNPTVTGYDASEKTRTLLTNNWYNYANPYFEWTTPQDEPSGAGLANVGVAGYYVYFGTDSGADPETLGTWQITTNLTSAVVMTSGATYYLRVKTEDALGNVSSATTVFIYEYDVNAPNNPLAPVNGWSANGSGIALTSGQWYNYANPYFDWLAVSDNPAGTDGMDNAGVRGYFKYFGISATGDPTGNFNSNLYYSPSTFTVSGTKYLRLRVDDNANLNATGGPAGNISSAVTAFEYRFDNDAPTTAVSSVTPIFDNGTKYVKGDFTVSGTAADTGGSGVGRVDVQIKDTTANEYWNGTAWQGGETWVPATGTTSWSYVTSSLALAGKNADVITVQSKAYDSVNGGGTNGNSGTSTLYSMTVDIAVPTFGTNNTAGTGTTGDTFTFSQDVTETGSGINGVDGYVKVEYWYGAGAHTVSVMANTVGSTYALGVTNPSNSVNQLHYFFRAKDNVGNAEVATTQVDVNITDNDDPDVDVITENTTATANGTKTIEADIADNIGVDDVVLHYKNFGGTWKTEEMERSSGNDQDGTWEATIDVQQSISGKMEYYVIAEDAANNPDTDNNSGSNWKITVVAGELDHFEVYSDTDPITSGDSFIITVIAKDQYGNNKNNIATANLTVKGWNGSAYVAITDYTASPASLTYTGNALKTSTITLTGTGGTVYDQIQVIATESSDADITGSVDLGATGFSATVAGVESNGSDGSVEGDQATPADQGVLGEGAQNEGLGSPVPWYRSLPFEIFVALFFGSTIWWWIRRRGSSGGAGSFSSFMFTTLKTAASRVRMFLW